MPQKFDHQSIRGYWDALAEEWEAKVGDHGDPFRRHLITPLISGLLTNSTGHLVLDVGCGNGYLTRLLTDQGYAAYGLDLSPRQLDYAMRRCDATRLTQQDIERIEFRLPLNFPPSFDIIIVSMVLDGIGDIETAIENCSALLGKNGTLVITIPHPCFYALFRFPEETFNYLVENHDLLTMTNVTKPVMYYHRPLNRYINSIIKSGLTVTKIVEPIIDDELKRYLKQSNRKELSCLVMGIEARK